MSENSNAGNYLWRGGQRIELEKEDNFFTAFVRNEAELERVRSLNGVKDVKPIQNRIFKVHISHDQIDVAMEVFRSEEMGGICHHAYRPKDAENTCYYLTDQIVISFAQDTPCETIDRFLTGARVKVLKEYPGSPNTYLVQVTQTAGKNPIKIANSLAEKDEVKYAEPNLINRFQSFHIPTDNYFRHQWHLNAWDGPNLVSEADVSAVDAWDVTRGSREVVIAVIDDGFDLSHPDFSGSGKVVHPKDYVDGDVMPFPTKEHGDYHGTPCAGVALAEENGKGVVGIAPICGFMPVRFPLSADDDFLWEIFDYVGKRADVISCSWGPPPVYAPLSQLIWNKFNELAVSGGPRKKGCLIFFAAGNYNAPLNDPENAGFIWRHPAYGLVKTQGAILNGNAVHPDVVTVAASTSLNRKAAYSNWGKEISVCAPSNNFHPLKPYEYVPGRGIWTTDNEQYGEGFTGENRFTWRFGGTSSATPLAAGVAGLVISTNPSLNAGEVKQIIQETADKVEDPAPDPVLGLKKGNYDAKGHSEWFGFGKINASRAVQRARELDKEESFSIDSNLKERMSPLTAKLIDDFFNTRNIGYRNLSGIGTPVIEASEKYKINATYIVAHAIHETGWGNSGICIDKNNLFGWGASPPDPYGNARAFSSRKECIYYVMDRINVNYLLEGGKYFRKKPCLGNKNYGMNVKYAGDPEWGLNIARLCRKIENWVSNQEEVGQDGQRIINAVNLVNPVQPYYQPHDITGDDWPETFCNWFVADILDVLGVSLPRYGPNDGAGSYIIPHPIYGNNPPMKPKSAYLLYNFFKNGGDNKWKAVNHEEGVEYANAGKVVVASVKKHIAIVVPGGTDSDVRIAQAGRVCGTDLSLIQGFGTTNVNLYVQTG